MTKAMLKQNFQKLVLIFMVTFLAMMILLTKVFAVALPPEVKPAGSGTKDDPYIISNGNNLVWMSKNNTSNGGFFEKYFIQTDDINFSGQLRPIGEDDNNPFYGNYDGDGHTITCNTLNTISQNSLGIFTNFLGLFGDNAGIIKNLGVDEQISGVGEFVGGLAAENDGSLINCYVKGTVNSKITLANVQNGYGTTIYSGELVGYNTGSITSCYAAGTVNAEQDFMYNKTKTYVGELVGKNDGEINNSYVKGIVNAHIGGNGGEQYFYAGGLIGQNSAEGKINNCYSIVKPILKEGDICSFNNGGLVCDNSGEITNCYATGDVNGKDTGGLVVYNSGKIIDSYATGNVSSSWQNSMFGGLVGENNGGVIKNSFSVGTLGACHQGCKSGGLVGSNDNSNSTIANCYYVDKSGTNGVGINNGTITKCAQKTDVSFYKTLSTYTTSTNWDSTAPWDFTNIWLINEANNSYPQLISTCSKVSGVKLDKTALTIVRGETGILKATFSPDNVYNAKLIWKSSNDKLVSVNNNNDCTATLTTDPNSSGNAIITVTTVDGGFSANCNVTVDNPKVSLPVASVTDGNINIGTKIYLSSQTKNTVFYYTLDGTIPTKNSLKYSDSIIINSSSILKVIGVCENMYDSDVLTVNYTAVTGVSKVEFDTHSISLVYDAKNPTTIKPTYTIYPSYAFNKNVIFSSSDTDIADVDSDGVVTGKKMGSAELTIKTVDGEFTDVCTISVVPKTISTASEFAKIGVDPDYPASYSYILLNDIDLSAFSISKRDFTGTFDGGGHTISNINSNLFESNSGVIKNLKVNGNISIDYSYKFLENNYIQGVIANTNSDSGSISNCSSSVQITFLKVGYSTTNLHGEQWVCIGGIVGRGDNVFNCDNNGSVKVLDNDDGDWCHVGGIVGSGGNITDCTNKGNITFNDNLIKASGELAAYVGGIVGSCDSVSNNIDRCANFGNLHAIVYTQPGLILSNSGYGSEAGSYVGGICAYSGVISNCYNCGEITSEADNGGKDSNSKHIFSNCAVATGIGGQASNCYNIGSISSNVEGQSKCISTADDLKNVYCLYCSTADAGGAIVKTNAELKKQETYSGFDFVNTWAINQNINNGYPYLIHNNPNTKTENLKISNLSDKGFTVTLNPALPGLTASDFTIIDSLSEPVNITGVTTSDNGATYRIGAALSLGCSYTFTAERYGYDFGMAQSFVIPLKPTILDISNSKLNELDLTWGAVSGAASYKIYRSSSAAGSFSLIGTSSVASYDDKNLMADTTYYYKVSAVNSNGESEQSGIVGKTTLKPYYSVNIGTTIGGTIVSDVQSAVYGTTINLKVMPNTGMKLKTGTLKYNDGMKDYLISGTSFAMPNANITVTGQFEEISGCPKYGDLNNDGIVDYKDYNCIKDYILGKINSFPALNNLFDRNVADLDGDGKVTSVDVAYLNRYLHKLIAIFPVEN